MLFHLLFLLGLPLSGLAAPSRSGRALPLSPRTHHVCFFVTTPPPARQRLSCWSHIPGYRWAYCCTPSQSLRIVGESWNYGREQRLLGYCGRSRDFLERDKEVWQTHKSMAFCAWCGSSCGSHIWSVITTPLCSVWATIPQSHPSLSNLAWAMTSLNPCASSWQRPETRPFDSTEPRFSWQGHNCPHHYAPLFQAKPLYSALAPPLPPGQSCFCFPCYSLPPIAL